MNCPYWKAPENPNQLKCFHRIISTQTEGFKGKPICTSIDINGMRCRKENEYSYKISDDVRQELPVGGLPEYAERPGLNGVSFVDAVRDVTESEFDSAVRAWQDAYVGDPPGTYRGNEGSWNNMSDIIQPNVAYTVKVPDIPQENCDHYMKGENGTCLNLAWCFKVFGTKLNCQVVPKSMVDVAKPEHRKLEVE